MSKSFLLLATLSLFFCAFPIEAKVLPRFAGGGKSSGGTYSSNFAVSPKLRADRKALNVYFSGLSKVKSVSYTLMYQGSGVDQGAMGSVDSGEGTSASRELLFGTCSTNVCTYHSAISNARLEVTVEQLSGKRSLKKYRIKV